MWTQQFLRGSIWGQESAPTHLPGVETSSFIMSGAVRHILSPNLLYEETLQSRAAQWGWVRRLATAGI